MGELKLVDGRDNRRRLNLVLPGIAKWMAWMQHEFVVDLFVIERDFVCAVVVVAVDCGDRFLDYRVLP